MQDENPREGKKKVKKTEEGKICTTAVKFNNNTITDFNGMTDVLAHLLFQPEVLSSVDLSFNDISKIGNVSGVVFTFSSRSVCFYGMWFTSFACCLLVSGLL